MCKGGADKPDFVQQSHSLPNEHWQEATRRGATIERPNAKSAQGTNVSHNGLVKIRERLNTGRCKGMTRV
jgi:hypothetical protein